MNSSLPYGERDFFQATFEKVLLKKAFKLPVEISISFE